MKLRLLLFLILLYSHLLLAVEIEITNPLDYRVRTVAYGRLVNASEDVPETFRIDIPERHIVRDQQGLINLERSLERWRSASSGMIGQPLVYPEGLGDCRYLFANRTGCDMYPFQNEDGETRYIALRYMYRQGERTEERPEDLRDVELNLPNGTTRTVPVRVPQPRFNEVTENGRRRVPNRYDLFSGQTPQPFLSEVQGGGWMDGVGLIRSLSEIKDTLERNLAAGNYSAIVDCNKSTSLDAEGPWTPEECYLCNCANEAGEGTESDQIAVNQVVLRRVVSDAFNPSRAFGRGICGAVMQRTQYSAQFSWVIDQWQTKHRLPDPTDINGRANTVRALRTCIDSGVKALERGPGAFDHYYSPGGMPKDADGNPIPPDWTRGVNGTRIGAHRFYNLRGSDSTHSEVLYRALGGVGQPRAAEGEEQDANR